MLPTGHIEFTWAALNVVQRRTGWFRDTDYRLMAVAALAPDLLDKPLALTFYRGTDAALFWGHNLWLHMAVWLAAWALIVGRTRSHREAGAMRRRFAGILPYLLAFSGHLLADRMWGFRESSVLPVGRRLLASVGTRGRAGGHARRVSAHHPHHADPGGV